MSTTLKREHMGQPLYGVVIDTKGRPKFDNIHDIPRPLWEILTPDERQHIRQQGGGPKGGD